MKKEVLGKCGIRGPRLARTFIASPALAVFDPQGNVFSNALFGKMESILSCAIISYDLQHLPIMLWKTSWFCRFRRNFEF